MWLGRRMPLYRRTSTGDLLGGLIGGFSPFSCSGEMDGVVVIFAQSFKPLAQISLIKDSSADVAGDVDDSPLGARYRLTRYGASIRPSNTSPKHHEWAAEHYYADFLAFSIA
jgi:hypothetical protein